MHGLTRRNAKKGVLVAAVAAALLTVSIFPAHALADENTDAVAYSETITGDRTYYNSFDEAMSAGYGGAVIYLNRDWQVSGSLQVADSKTLSINMNGHKITGDGTGAVFIEHEHSSLSLSSDTPTTFSYTGYNTDGSKGDCSVTSGGLVTGGIRGVALENDSNLTLSNVAVAGNRDDFGGGVSLNQDCSLIMNRGATITHNCARLGGGVYICDGLGDYRNMVQMDNASICANYATEGGGGLYSNVDEADIRIENNSTISDNVTKGDGGGIYLSHAHFNVQSGDRSGSISGNKADGDNGGGAIYVSDASLCDHHGTITGLTMKDNSVSTNGGAIYIDQDYTYVTDCTITGNGAAKTGGGIYVHSGNCAITNGTITGNYCDGVGTNREGGGVFVRYKYDLTLSGKCNITGNTRGKNGSADNVFLSDYCGAHAYILGGVDEGSQVGIRTGNTDDSQMVGKNISTYTEGTYSMDLPAYRLTHGTDHNGDLWQRKA